MIYVAGDPGGAWSSRLEGLADGAKIAVAERNGIMGARAVSTVVVPIEQRDGDQVSAAVGTGRILRDSRTLAVLGTYSAPQLEISAAQLNGGEISLLQYGTGMLGLTQAGRPGEPGRYQPSGRNLALRGVPSDAAIAKAVGGIAGTKGITSVLANGAFNAQQASASRAAVAAAKSAHDAAVADGKTGDDVPPLIPGSTRSVYNPVSDAARIAEAIHGVTGGDASDQLRKGAQILVIDPTERDPAAIARRAARGSRGLLVVIDGADRPIAASAVAGHDGPVYRVRRALAPTSDGVGQRVRAKERELFGRDRGDAVVAGYRAAKRMLDLGASQPDKTIDRLTYAEQLSGDAPSNAQLPVRDAEVTLGEVVVERLSGGRWLRAR
ncbi:MAG: hypothetical protein J7513_11955 [Solirubrobacteraceae bacterium]|nr:hypothetical protein [Solirubrobacteraceae bacterium]